MKKISVLISLLLIMTVTMGNVAYAAPELTTPETEIEARRYEILDTITYGLSFDGTQVYCYAFMHSAHAEKYTVSGMLQKKNSNGYYDYVCTWSEETYYGQSCRVILENIHTHQIMEFDSMSDFIRKNISFFSEPFTKKTLSNRFKKNNDFIENYEGYNIYKLRRNCDGICKSS